MKPCVWQVQGPGFLQTNFDLAPPLACLMTGVKLHAFGCFPSYLPVWITVSLLIFLFLQTSPCSFEVAYTAPQMVNYIESVHLVTTLSSSSNCLILNCNSVTGSPEPLSENILVKHFCIAGFNHLLTSWPHFINSSLNCSVDMSKVFSNITLMMTEVTTAGSMTKRIFHKTSAQNCKKIWV